MVQINYSVKLKNALSYENYLNCFVYKLDSQTIYLIVLM